MAVYEYLQQIVSYGHRLTEGSLLVEMQIAILGDLLVKKIHPKIIVVKKKHQVKLTRAEGLAFQRSVFVGWPGLLAGVDQYKILEISYREMPKVVVNHPRALEALDKIDIYEEE